LTNISQDILFGNLVSKINGEDEPPTFPCPSLSRIFIPTKYTETKIHMQKLSTSLGVLKDFLKKYQSLSIGISVVMHLTL
jgi:hypothetical protein